MIATTMMITATSPELNKTEIIDCLANNIYEDYIVNMNLSINKESDQSSSTLRSVNLCPLRTFN